MVAIVVGRIVKRKGWLGPSVLLAIVVLLSGKAVHAGPMSMAGQFEVSPTGAATYTIPIQVPPGTAGIEPKLSLVYNSQSGNGLLGVGWSLSGLSAITRCPRTMAQDGVRGGVNYDLNDRYCLDGQRLMAISGTYGADGTEYRTERESFSKIVSYGMAGNGPAWFKVWTKAGLILEYGDTADSRIEVQGKSSVRVWAMNKLSDTEGNYLTVSYIEDNPNGDYYPNRIDYAANASAGLASNNSVQFTYEARPDVVSLYAAGGGLVRNSVRATNIRSYANQVLVKDYRLTYNVSSVTQRSRLNSLSSCNGTGGCLPSMSLSWRDGGGGFTYVQTVNGDWKDYYTIYPGDYNGDGITDVFLIGSNWNFFCAGPGIASGVNCVQINAADWKDNYAIYPGDYNGDGITDLFLIGANGNFFCAGPGIASGTNCVQINTADWKNNYQVYPGDYNGDGIADLFLTGANGNFFCAGPGIASGTNCVQINAADWKNNYRIYPGDYNGDGITDLFLIGANGNFFCAGPGITSGTNCVQINAADWKDYYAVYPGDYNGDGITDLFLIGANGNFFCAGPGITSGTNCVQINAADWKDYYAVYPGDYNGDGITDVFLIGANGNFFCAGPGIASGTNCVQINAGDWKDNYAIYPGDYNGDGATDLYLVGSTASYFVLGANGRPDILSSIVDGTGVSATISYQPLTNNSVYTKGSGAAYPNQDVQAAMYVVSQVQTTNGVGGNITSNFRYGSLEADLSGRGLLGFGWLQATNSTTGISARTDYRQDWPYVGLPSAVKKTVASGGNAGLLSQTTYSYGCLNPQLGSACTMAAGNRYFPYVSQSVESGYDLSGTALPTVTTTNQFDTYGNATQVSVTSSDGNSKTTTNSYTNDPTNWTLGRLQRSQVQSVTP